MYVKHVIWQVTHSACFTVRWTLYFTLLRSEIVSWDLNKRPFWPQNPYMEGKNPDSWKNVSGFGLQNPEKNSHAFTLTSYKMKEGYCAIFCWIWNAGRKHSELDRNFRIANGQTVGGELKAVLSFSFLTFGCCACKMTDCPLTIYWQKVCHLQHDIMGLADRKLVTRNMTV